MSQTPNDVEFRQVDDEFAVAGQIGPEHMPAIVEAGFRSLICNRPDGEAPTEPQFDTVRAAAEAAGLAVRYIPVSSQIGLTPDNVAETRVALAEMDGPILAYCRSGARSANLYAAAG